MFSDELTEVVCPDDICFVGNIEIFQLDRVFRYALRAERVITDATYLFYVLDLDN